VIRVLLFFYLAWQVASPQATEHMQAGIAAEKQRQFDVAIKEFKQVTELDPSFADGFISLGQAYMESGDYGAAIAPLKHALELNADLLPAHQLLGYALHAQGYAREAIQHLQRSPDKTALGIAQIQTGQLPEAVANLQASLAAHPSDPDLLYYLGRASGLLYAQSMRPGSAKSRQSVSIGQPPDRDIALHPSNLEPGTWNLGGVRAGAGGPAASGTAAR